jgi:hypothetical protein
MDERLEFHHSVRERFGESLHYYFLSFDPPYEFVRVKDAITDFFRDQTVESFSSFEIFGAVDVIVRAWIPSTKATRLASALNKHLDRKKCTVAYSAIFNVSNVLFHSYWRDRPPVFESDNAADALDQWSVAKINDEETRKDLLERNWLRETRERDARVRMFISIPPMRQRSAVADFVEMEIGEALENSGLEDAVLYHGLGQHTELLIEAQVKVEDYFEISLFNDTINKLGLQRFGSKTTTYLTTKNFALADKPKVAAFDRRELAEPRLIEEYLLDEESESLEHKGSFEVDVSRFLSTEQVVQNPKLSGEILSTITAFLNTDGGEIVIGAVEEKKFKGAVLEKLKEKFPTVGEMRITGIAWEYQFCRDKSWDGFQRRILDSMADRIGASYGDLVRIRRLAGKVDGDRDAEICLIQVAPSKLDVAFLDGDACFIRSGASTRQLKGQELKRFIERRR